MTKKNAFYAQSGGVTAVINASACGVIETARKHKDKIANVYAGQNGIIGALTEKLIDTRKDSARNIAKLKHTPGSAFGSCRYKLKNLDEDKTQYERLIDVFRVHNIGYFFYNGGGDSQDTTYKVSQISEAMGYPLTCIGIPKTVDNDLPITDSCPGFGSVAKYVSISTMEAALDLRSMAKTSTKIFILEVMGRHAGWIAAAAGLAAREEDDAPHIILFPEIAFDQKRFLARVKRSVRRYDHCVIVASEGVRDKEGAFLVDSDGSDPFGHRQLGGLAPSLANLIQTELGYKYHWAVADYLQRSARHIAAKSDVEHAYALGKAAVELALKGQNAVMATIVRKSSKPYRWTTGVAPLASVANVEKMMPRNFISRDGFAITDKCREYIQPLIKGEDYPPYKNGLPDYVTLKNVLVPPKLNEQFKI